MKASALCNKCWKVHGRRHLVDAGDAWGVGIAGLVLEDVKASALGNKCWKVHGCRHLVDAGDAWGVGIACVVLEDVTTSETSLMPNASSVTKVLFSDYAGRAVWGQRVVDVQRASKGWGVVDGQCVDTVGSTVRADMVPAGS